MTPVESHFLGLQAEPLAPFELVSVDSTLRWFSGLPLMLQRSPCKPEQKQYAILDG